MLRNPMARRLVGQVTGTLVGHTASRMIEGGLEMIESKFRAQEERLQKQIDAQREMIAALEERIKVLEQLLGNRGHAE